MSQEGSSRDEESPISRHLGDRRTGQDSQCGPVVLYKRSSDNWKERTKSGTLGMEPFLRPWDKETGRREGRGWGVVDPTRRTVRGTLERTKKTTGQR